MRIAILVEGKTETAFLPYLREFLKVHLSDKMPKLDPTPYDGRIPTDDKLKRVVVRLLNDGDRPADLVIALTDVYTGTNPPDFTTATDAKAKMRQWVGAESRFHPHVALHDFEAWLLPYWPLIQQLAGHNMTRPGQNPETVNHDKPPAHRIKEIFRLGVNGKRYVKPRDAARILRESNLSDAVEQCAELKAFVNTIISACGGTVIP